MTGCQFFVSTFERYTVAPALFLYRKISWPRFPVSDSSSPFRVLVPNFGAKRLRFAISRESCETFGIVSRNKYILPLWNLYKIGQARRERGLSNKRRIHYFVLIKIISGVQFHNRISSRWQWLSCNDDRRDDRIGKKSCIPKKLNRGV